MGPRPRGRGNITNTSALPAAVKCFNGAAPARARKSAARHRLRQRPARFNGAAPARARKSAWLRPSPVAAWIASMGPRPRGRGNHNSFHTHHRHITELQWGRARAGAEMHWPWTSAGLRRWSFNGAAPARARKCRHRPARPRARGDMLQWGRARAGAEILPA